MRAVQVRLWRFLHVVYFLLFFQVFSSVFPPRCPRLFHRLSFTLLVITLNYSYCCFVSYLALLARHELRMRVDRLPPCCHCCSCTYVGLSITQNPSCCCCVVVVYISYERISKHFLSRHPTMCGMSFNADHSLVNKL